MLRRGEVGCRALNDHGNYIVDHGNIMEKSWNFVFEFLWEPCWLPFYLMKRLEQVDRWLGGSGWGTVFAAICGRCRTR